MTPTHYVLLTVGAVIAGFVIVPRRLAKDYLTLLTVSGVVIGGGWLTYFGPYYKDYYVMQEVAESGALTWAAYSKERGRHEVADQLKRREIDYVTPAHCELHEGIGTFIVTCRWQVDVYPPLIGGRRLDFEAEAVASKDGRLVVD